jgi:hypothetical protein
VILQTGNRRTTLEKPSRRVKAPVSGSRSAMTSLCSSMVARSRSTTSRARSLSSPFACRELTHQPLPFEKLRAASSGCFATALIPLIEQEQGRQRGMGCRYHQCPRGSASGRLRRFWGSQAKVGSGRSVQIPSADLQLLFPAADQTADFGVRVARRLLFHRVAHQVDQSTITTAITAQRSFVSNSAAMIHAMVATARASNGSRNNSAEALITIHSPVRVRGEGAIRKFGINPMHQNRT